MARPRDRTMLSARGEQILDAVADGVVAVDATGAVAFVSSAAERMLRISRGGATGRQLRDVLPEGPLHNLFMRSLRTGTSIVETRARIPVRQGQPLEATITAAPLLDERMLRSGVVLTIQHGIEGTIHAEDERRRDRLAQVGIVASGLAHEIKNPLGGIKGAAQLLQRELKESPGLRRHTEVIIKEANRVNALIRSLLDLAKPKATERAEVNVNRVLNEILTLQVQTPEGQKVKLVTEFDPSIPPVMGDEEQLTGVFLNIIRNALDVSPFRGKLRVRTRVVTDYILLSDAGSRRKVIRVDVEDDGPGISPDELEKIFTPFYTTKTGGTGLGLTLSNQVVLDHDGHIEIRPRSPKGTRVEVFLPSAPVSRARINLKSPRGADGAPEAPRKPRRSGRPEKA